MKKVTTISATFLASFLLVACSSNSATPSNDSQSESTSSSVVTRKPSKPKVPVEYASALTKAQMYSDTVHFSKKGLYRQLTSSAGEKFSEKSAQYAIAHVKADWNKNALLKAKDYQDQQAMSPASIKTQLTSSYGEQFTESQAQYALAHLNG